ncbi:AMP-binding protein [Dactylosporangium sp. CA-233914]|uniref:AMP-binding protein n=1 Tax=Dactylosporangium sp. CA-233914 TaxID=3239934 RepID=UPI003D92B800
MARSASLRWTPPNDIALGELLATQAHLCGEATFLRHAKEALTFAQFDSTVESWSKGLADIGIGYGEFVAVMLPNSIETLVTWFSLNRVGAVYAAVNTGFKGQALASAFGGTRCTTLVIDAAYLDAFAYVAVDCPQIQRLVVRGSTAEPKRRFPALEVLSWDDLLASGRPTPVPVDPTDAAMVIFTSGTTGRSKGCVLSHRSVIRSASLFSSVAGLTTNDVLYCPFPLFHADATYLTTVPALLNGSTAAIAPRFSVSRFWTDIRDYEATVFDFMGATLTMLWNQPPRDDDADNPARLGWGVPVPAFADKFEKRFELRLISGYGLTEASPVLFQELDWSGPKSSCGVPVWPFEVALLDDRDDPVPKGATGEIAVRSALPGMMFDGYLGMPTQTLEANRNLWFHTGDLAHRDANGHYHFDGRKSDSIRRRGENISAQEIEEVFLSRPDIAECAAVAVPSELGEDDVKLHVVPTPGTTIDPAELIDYARPRMADYMLPRYIQVRGDLPHTPTSKIDKRQLRDEGIGEGAWQRDG